MRFEQLCRRHQKGNPGVGQSAGMQPRQLHQVESDLTMVLWKMLIADKRGVANDGVETVRCVQCRLAEGEKVARSNRRNCFPPYQIAQSPSSDLGFLSIQFNAVKLHNDLVRSHAKSLQPARCRKQ